MQNAPREHSAILSTSNELPFVFKTIVLSIFELPLKTGFTVLGLFIIVLDGPVAQWVAIPLLIQKLFDPSPDSYFHGSNGTKNLTFNDNVVCAKGNASGLQIRVCK